MTIRIVIDNEDAIDANSEDHWTANAYLVNLVGDLTLITPDSPGLGRSPAEALAAMRPDFDFSYRD